MREPIAAGTFYERNPELLRDQVEAHYNGPRGPGAEPLREISHNVAGIIAPNSPYKNCGDALAWSYKYLAESPLPDVYVIIATNQHSQESGISLTTFNTPLGIVRVDQELGRAVAQKGTIGINEEIHLRDHVIEVQLPFLLDAKYSEFEHIKILPVLVARGEDIKALALDIKESLIDLGKKAIFICSTDLTHYGPLFHYVPWASDIQEHIYELDRGAIECIKKQDVTGFEEYAKENILNYHGTAAIELMLHLLPKCDARLEQYFTSGDVLGDYKNAVAYASIVSERILENP
jgi:MEMO1 family protein